MSKQIELVGIYDGAGGFVGSELEDRDYFFADLLSEDGSTAIDYTGVTGRELIDYPRPLPMQLDFGYVRFLATLDGHGEIAEIRNLVSLPEAPAWYRAASGLGAVA